MILLVILTFSLLPPPPPAPHAHTGVIIGLTGNAISDDIATILHSGVNCVLMKPLDMTLFLSSFDKFYAALDVVNTASLARLQMLQEVTQYQHATHGDSSSGTCRSASRSNSVHNMNGSSRDHRSLLLLDPQAVTSKTLCTSFNMFGFTTTNNTTVQDVVSLLSIKSLKNGSHTASAASSFKNKGGDGDGGGAGSANGPFSVVVVSHTVPRAAEAVKMLRVAGFRGVIVGLTSPPSAPGVMGVESGVPGTPKLPKTGSGTEEAVLLKQSGADAALYVPLDMSLFLRTVKKLLQSTVMMEV
jgi:hypothetical protein